MVLLSARGLCYAQDFSLESAGIRLGASPTSNGHDFHQAEAFLNLNLPWHWDLGRNWSLQSRLDFSAGWLGSSAADTAIGTLGPSLLLRHGEFPLSLEAGSSPTGLSSYDLITKNFGERFQFTTHIGFNIDVWRHWRIGYRFSHMSNAGISGSNSGLNLHILTVCYLF